MSLSVRVKAVRMSLKMTQEEFAKKLDLKVFSISRYETGARYPDSKTLQKLQRIYHVDINWLFTGEGEMFITELKTISTENVHIMPIEAEIAAGDPEEVTGEKHSTYSLDKALIPDVSNSICFRVNGHSMEPGIEHQDIVIINKDCNWHDKDGIICAIRTDGEIAIKRIMHGEKDKMLVLVSDNRSYPPIVVDPEHSDVILIGTLQMVIRMKV